MTRDLGGRLLLSAIAIFLAVGSVLADWNATHMFNPNWPPHAKFHTAHTLAMGTFLALATLFFAWRRSGDRPTNNLVALLLAGAYFWTQGAAAFFPNVAWTDPEFLRPGQSLTQFPPPQLVMDAAVTALVLLSAWLLRSETFAARATSLQPVHE